MEKPDTFIAVARVTRGTFPIQHVMTSVQLEKIYGFPFTDKMEHFQSVDKRVNFTHEAFHEDDFTQANTHVA